jgi:hypothetical protein
MKDGSSKCRYIRKGLRGRPLKRQQSSGCPILRASCEGWGPNTLDVRAVLAADLASITALLVEAFLIPPFVKKREGPGDFLLHGSSHGRVCGPGQPGPHEVRCPLQRKSGAMGHPKLAGKDEGGGRWVARLVTISFR